MSTSDKETTPGPALRTGYPGLGLPLWQNENFEDPCFPYGGHTYGAGSTSKPLPVRELAMLSVMDTLTDKPDWHNKVFVEEIVAKWRKEAMAIPNEEFRGLATSSKRQQWDDNGNVELSESFTGAPVTDDLLSATTFDCVSRYSYAMFHVLIIFDSVLRNFAAKPNSSSARVLHLPWMRTRRSQNQTALFPKIYAPFSSTRSKLCRQTRVSRHISTRSLMRWSRTWYIPACTHWSIDRAGCSTKR
jgi:hypothetical protein